MDERQRNGADRRTQGSAGSELERILALFTSWPFVVLAFIVGLWPVGLFLIFYGAELGNRKKTQTRTAQTTRCTSARTGAAAEKTVVITDTAGAQTTVTKTTKRTTKTTTKKKPAKTPGKSAGLAFLILGAFLAFGGLMNLIDTVDMILWSGSFAGYFAEFWQSLTFLAAGGGLFGLGLSRRRRQRRYPRYLAFLGQRRAVPLREIASAMGLSQRRVVRDLQKMLEDGLLPRDAYLDMGRECYFADADAVPEEKPAEPAPVKAQEDEYDAILRSIRELNDRIADEKLSADIDRIEDISRKIFREVERCPEKKGQISTLLNYYLPTTQKLLDSYATFEAAGVEGSNMTQAKERIEQTMARIVQGFEKQLDQLYSADAMDVESDIRVMENMLNRDGAGAEQDFELRL